MYSLHISAPFHFISCHVIWCNFDLSFHVMSFHYIRSRFHFSWFLCFWGFAFTDSLPTHCFIASLIYWFSGSCFRWNTVIQWFIFPWILDWWVLFLLNHGFNVSCIHGLIGALFVDWLVHWCTESCGFSLIDWLISRGSLIHWLNVSLSRSFMCWYMHPSIDSIIHQFFDSFIPSFIHFLHSFILPLLHSIPSLSSSHSGVHDFRYVSSLASQQPLFAHSVIHFTTSTCQNIASASQKLSIDYRPLISIVKKASNQPVHWDATA